MDVRAASPDYRVGNRDDNLSENSRMWPRSFGIKNRTTCRKVITFSEEISETIKK